jgi:hypothetical protein
MNWNKEGFKSAIAVLGKSLTVEDACKELDITPSALRSAFNRAVLHAPSSFLAAHPLEKVQSREEESLKDRHIKTLTQELREAAERQKFLNAAKGSNKAPPRIFPRDKNPKLREMTAVVLASDWHVEEPVDGESVAYRNEYNLSIADTRVKRFFEGMIWNVEHQRGSGKILVNDLVLWLGGDLMTGYIHPELMESSQLSPTETVRWLMPRLRAGIHSILEHLKLDHIVIPCSFGNHGRTTEKPRISTGYANSYEWLMYHCLADGFQDDPRVQFEVTNSPHQYVQVYDYMLHFHHGDDVKYAGGIGGLGVPLLKAVPSWDLVKKSDYHHIGHHHTLLDYGRVIVNGSLIGYGPYSQRIRAQYEKPAQAMYYLDKSRGKTMLTPIWVSE